MASKSKTEAAPDQLDATDSATGTLNVIIETPKGSRNKFTYDEAQGRFKLSGVLPAGAIFPFDFGFLPATQGEDGDPLDVLLLLDEPVFAGCLVPARLIGVIEAEQTEDGKTTRNDRLVAVAEDSRAHQAVRTLDHLSPVLLDEIEHFFVSYNQIKGKQFKPLGRFGPARARRLMEEGSRAQRGKSGQAKSTKAKSGKPKKSKKG